MVHNADIVPQGPRLDQAYFHAAYEIFESVDGSLKQCDATGEDITC